MRVVGRDTGRGGCRERGWEMGEDNWGRGVVKVHQRISAVGRGRGKGRKRWGEKEGGEKEGGWGREGGGERKGGGGREEMESGRQRGRGKVMESEGVGRG